MLESKIKILPEFIANQIAAGEVVQRPESVVKELVENSIDAGADSIAVIVKQAGKNLIHIVDNGFGMNKDDLMLSIKRHATSKVFTSDDLEQIRTFGFRGEALASVCSVANIEIRTKQKDEQFGWQLLSEPSKTELVNPINTDNGTQIFVRNLFYNVPARRKFLKSDMTEFRYISDTMIKFALSYPEIRFTFYDDNILIFDVKPTVLQTRIAEILGKHIVEKLIPIHHKDTQIEISGFVGEPELAKQNRSGQYFFLNKRAIFSPNLAHSINSVYENFLDRNQKPFFILNLTVDFKKIDINIHPQKHEVKFEEERYIYNTLKNAVSSALFDKQLIPDLRAIEIDSPFVKIQDNNEFIEVNRLTGEIIESRNSHSNQQRNDYPFSQNKNYDSNYNWNQEHNYSRKDLNNINSAFDMIFSNKQEQLIEDNLGKIYQILSRFIIRVVNDFIEIYDQNATHKRIIYDKLKRKDFKPNTNKLLFPIVLKINNDGALFIKDNVQILNNAGFFFDFNSESISFYEIPDLIKNGKESEVLQNLVDNLIQLPNITNFDLLDNIYKQIAETLAVKTGQNLSQEEMQNIIKEIQNCEHKLISPNGTRTFTKLNSEQFYQKFLRL